MDELIGLFQGGTRLLAVFGGGLSSVCIAWAGVLWMTSSGDPQKVSQARMALMGAAGGLVIVGLAFAVPRIVSAVVIEPAGGVGVQNRVGTDCDGVLRRMLVVHKTASTVERMQVLVRRIQARRGDCREETWNPVVKTAYEPTGLCFLGSGTALQVGSLPLPADFYRDDGGEKRAYRLSSRDGSGNILVYWSEPVSERPSDAAFCWLYMASLDRWASSGTKKAVDDTSGCVNGDC